MDTENKTDGCQTGVGGKGGTGQMREAKGGRRTIGSYKIVAVCDAQDRGYGR